LLFSFYFPRDHFEIEMLPVMKIKLAACSLRNIQCLPFRVRLYCARICYVLFGLRQTVRVFDRLVFVGSSKEAPLNKVTALLSKRSRNFDGDIKAMDDNVGHGACLCREKRSPLVLSAFEPKSDLGIP
jgi:hypothetical protein